MALPYRSGAENTSFEYRFFGIYPGRIVSFSGDGSLHLYVPFCCRGAKVTPGAITFAR